MLIFRRFSVYKLDQMVYIIKKDGQRGKKYVRRIEELTNTKVKFLGVGAGRDEIIINE